MRNREEIDNKYKWDVSHVYSNDKEWAEDMAKLREYSNEVENFKGKLGDKEVLLKHFEYSKNLDILADKVLIYVYLQHMLDVDNDKYNMMLGEYENWANEFAVKASYITPELNSYDVSYLESLLNDSRFELHYMDIKDLIKQKPHILPHELEEVVTKVGNFAGAFSDIYDGFDCVDLKFQDAEDSNGNKHAVTKSNFAKLMENRDRVLRKNAYINHFKSYEDSSTILANNYIGSVKKDCFYSDIYKYDSVLVANLEGRDLTEKVYYTLLDNVNKHMDLKHRWASIKKKVLKLDKAYPYDMGVPISSMDREFSYEEAVTIVKNALSILGNDYMQAVNTAFDNNWIDVYPTKNKDTGGCCMSVSKIHPYILLNYEGTFSDVSTIAHEMGHAMHHYFVELNQPFEYTGVSIFLAEIASTTNEVILMKYMYENCKDRDEKIYMLEEYISLIFATLFSQCMYSEFEDYAHKVVERHEPLTKEMLLNKYAELQDKYAGDVIEKMDCQKYAFMRVPHFYRAYYVYTYSTGITCAINLAKSCENGNKEGVAKIRKFLSAGSSKYPLDILKDCGIDLETDQPYDIVMEELKWALDEIEKLAL